MKKKIGVVLAGSGHLDGSEIREAVLTLLALDKHGKEHFDIEIYAPDQDQHHVLNHITGEEVKETRNVLVEAARIARGKISPLSEAKATELEAIILPGGFGVAKNLSNFAFEGNQGEVISDLKNLLEMMRNSAKPIGAICISPAVLSLLFGKEGAKLTIGSDEATAKVIESLGAEHIKTQVHEIIVDEKLKIVSTPAYMYDEAAISDIALGIDKCVQRVLAWIDHD
ncbi:MAG: isoprenoid biosynthesis glyoxalase ElbB [Halobacteriovoraceae bacterium]|nr:isoprenoid biosynthesis glyoxalase ElbB [Halobacteriovoraceae bacterium]